MLAIIVYALVALVFAAVAAWLARRVLDARIGWLRSFVSGVVVFVVGSPLALWSLESADVLDENGIAVDDAIAALFLALTGGWMLAVVVVAIVGLEFLWPTRPVGGPVGLVRGMFRRRDRARRYAQILAIASRHGLGLYRRRRTGDGEDLPTALVAATNEAGVTFIKIGQILSSRDDILPHEVTSALSTLQMQTTPISWPAARGAIEQQLGRPVGEVFAHIDETPLAAASVAQVHAATLLTGEEVVVKIQRPSARAQVSTDLDIIERLARDAERHTDWGRDYGAAALAAEFGRALREELDYRREAENTEMLRGAVERSAQRVLIPRVFAAYTTAQMLVQERARGVPLSRLDAAARDAETAHAIADGLLDAVFEQIAVRGVFHADLHPGNVLLADDGTVTLIDFGSVGVLEKSMRRMLIPLLIAMANEDDIAATDVILMVVAPTEEGAVDRTALQRDVGVILTRLHNSRVDENIFRSLIEVIRAHRLALPPSLLLVFRTLASLEGSLRRIRPGYDMVARALSRAPHFALELVGPRELALTMQTQAMIATAQLRRAPRRLELLAQELEKGTLAIRLRTFEDQSERTWIEAVVGRFTTTLVGIALVATAVLLSTSGGGPSLTPDVPLHPFLGSAAGLGGLLLLLHGLRAAFARRRSG